MVQIMTKHFYRRDQAHGGGLWGMDRELQAGPGWAEPQQRPSPGRDLCRYRCSLCLSKMSFFVQVCCSEPENGSCAD